MKLPINWLRDYVDFDIEPSELIHKLTSVGHMQDGPYKKVGNDIVYDLEIRQNRADCLSIIGLARETGAVLNTKIKLPKEYVSEIPTIKKDTKIEIENPELCPRFDSVTIEGIKIGESPKWLKEKLETYGIKSINNLVDITNFVMIEIGRPMHAFDANKVSERHLIVRNAKKGESLTVLGGKVIKLVEDDLVVASPNQVLGLAGIIGGVESGIQNSTTSVILESATWNQATIRRSSLRHQIRTEASTRLEKFTHPHLAELGLRRGLALILELCGGKLVDHTDTYLVKPEEKTIELSIKNLNRLSGVTISLDEANTLLNRLELPTKKGTDSINVSIPYFRTDIEQEEDVIEEVLRIFGYDNIPAQLPAFPPPLNVQSSLYEFEEEIRNALVGFGFNEEITEPLVNESQSKLTPIKLENSLSSEKIMLRTTLEESLLKTLVEQKKYKKPQILLFEIGKIYFLKGNDYVEQRTLGVLTYSTSNSYTSTKGFIEALFEKLLIRFDHSIVEINHVGVNTFFSEINIEQMYALKRNEKATVYTTPPQVIFQDLSLLVDIEVKVGELLHEVRNSSSMLSKVTLGEEPRTQNDKKSVFLKLEFLSSDKNLTKEDVIPEKETIIKTLKEKYQAEIR